MNLGTDAWLSHNTPVVIVCFFLNSRFLSLPPTRSGCKAVAVATGHSVMPPGHQHSVGALRHCCPPHKSTPFLFHQQVHQLSSHHCCTKNRGVTTGELSLFILYRNNRTQQFFISSLVSPLTHTREVVLLSDGVSGRFWGCTIFIYLFFLNLVVFSWTQKKWPSLLEASTLQTNRLNSLFRHISSGKQKKLQKRFLLKRERRTERSVIIPHLQMRTLRGTYRRSNLHKVDQPSQYFKHWITNMTPLTTFSLECSTPSFPKRTWKGEHW